MLSHNDPGRLSAVHSAEQRPLSSRQGRGGAVHRLVACRATEATSWARSTIVLLTKYCSRCGRNSVSQQVEISVVQHALLCKFQCAACQQLKLPLCGEVAMSHAGCWPSRVMTLHTTDVCDRGLTYVARSSRSQLYCSLSRPVPSMSPCWSLADVSPTYADRAMKCTAPTCGGQHGCVWCLIWLCRLSQCRLRRCQCTRVTTSLQAALDKALNNFKSDIVI